MVPDYPLDVIALIGIKDEQDIEYEEVCWKRNYIRNIHRSKLHLNEYLNIFVRYIFIWIIGFGKKKNCLG